MMRTWKPMRWETYYTVTEHGHIVSDHFDENKRLDLLLYKLGKMYRTKQEAERHEAEDKNFWSELKKEYYGK